MLERQREGIATPEAKKRYKSRAPTVAVQGEQIRSMVASGEKPARVVKKLGVARSGAYRMIEAG